jgi:DNA-binding LacI/PurR family transcriptional regulator
MAPDTEVASGGRGATSLAESIRGSIAGGTYPVGKFLPATRQLSGEHGVTAETVRRALKLLQRDGLLASVPRHGFRVMSRANDPTRGCPVAYVLSSQKAGAVWTGFNQVLLGSLQGAAARRGWSILGTGAAGLRPRDILDQCLASRAWGLIVDVHDPEIVRLARKAGLAAVMVDAWHEDAGVDAVIQDNFLGGKLAGQHLAAHGHKEAAWFGPVTGSVHSLERFGGAVAGLRKGGARLAAEIEVDIEDPELAAKARSFLERKGRPAAVLALWSNLAQALVAAAGELGIKVDGGLDIVGWCSEELYESEYRAGMGSAKPPPAVTWRVKDLADMAITRLAQRLAEPNLVPQRISVPVRLKTSGGNP